MAYCRIFVCGNIFIFGAACSLFCVVVSYFWLFFVPWKFGANFAMLESMWGGGAILFLCQVAIPVFLDLGGKVTKPNFSIFLTKNQLFWFFLTFSTENHFLDIFDQNRLFKGFSTFLTINRFFRYFWPKSTFQKFFRHYRPKINFFDIFDQKSTLWTFFYIFDQKRTFSMFLTKNWLFETFGIFDPKSFFDIFDQKSNFMKFLDIFHQKLTSSIFPSQNRFFWYFRTKKTSFSIFLTKNYSLK